MGKPSKDLEITDLTAYRASMKPKPRLRALAAGKLVEFTFWDGRRGVKFNVTTETAEAFRGDIQTAIQMANGEP